MANPSIRAASDVIAALVPSYVMLGDDGDARHGCRGYHIRATELCEDGCYSRCLPPDLGGNPNLSSAWDLGFGTQRPVTGLIRATKWLFAAMKRHDPVVAIVREAYGTLDGWNTHGWDQPSNSSATTSEDHTTHMHVSIYRSHNENTAALKALARALAEAVNGTTTPTEEEPLKLDAEDRAWIAAQIEDEVRNAVRFITTGVRGPIYDPAKRKWVASAITLPKLSGAVAAEIVSRLPADGSLTKEQIEDAVRTVFADAGVED